MNPTDSSPLFHTWPLVAITICTTGVLVRALAMRDGVHAARQAFHHARRLFWSGWVLAVGLVPLLAGHLAGLLFPHAILSWNRAPMRLYLLEGVAFGVGLLTLVAWARAVWRHLRRTDEPFVVEMADSLFLAMLFLAIGSGLGMAALDRWASSWGVVTLRPYALSLLAGNPRSALVDHLPFLVRIHLFSTFAALAVFPATRLAPLPILLASRALAVCVRAVAATVARSGAKGIWTRLAALLWNEPQYRWRVKPVAPTEGAVATTRGERPRRPLVPQIAAALGTEGASRSPVNGSARRTAGKART